MALMPGALRITSALAFSGFGDIGAKAIDGNLIIDLQNYRYFYATRALDVALSTIAPFVEDTKVKDIAIIFKDSGMPLSHVRIPKRGLPNYVKYRNGPYGAYTQPTFSTDYVDIPVGRKLPRPPPFAVGFKPQFNLFLSDPSGFLKANLGLSAWASTRIWTGGSLVAGIAYYPFNEISTVNEPMSMPVRTGGGLSR